jgi:hypothetical protein
MWPVLNGHLSEALHENSDVHIQYSASISFGNELCSS